MYKYDLSLPPNDMYKLVEEMRARMKHLPVNVVGYGHMGDSNLHLNISAGEHCTALLAVRFSTLKPNCSDFLTCQLCAVNKMFADACVTNI